MWRAVLVVLMLLGGSGAALAVSEEVMEAQRCIWSCNSDTGGKQPAYDRCIAKNCDVGPRKRKRR